MPSEASFVSSAVSVGRDAAGLLPVTARDCDQAGVVRFRVELRHERARARRAARRSRRARRARARACGASRACPPGSTSHLAASSRADPIRARARRSRSAICASSLRSFVRASGTARESSRAARAGSRPGAPRRRGRRPSSSSASPEESPYAQTSASASPAASSHARRRCAFSGPRQLAPSSRPVRRPLGSRSRRVHTTPCTPRLSPIGTT